MTGIILRMVKELELWFDPLYWIRINIGKYF